MKITLTHLAHCHKQHSERLKILPVANFQRKIYFCERNLQELLLIKVKEKKKSPWRDVNPWSHARGARVGRGTSLDSRQYHGEQRNEL